VQAILLDYWSLRPLSPDSSAGPLRLRLKGTRDGQRLAQGVEDFVWTSAVSERLAWDVVRTEDGTLYRLGALGAWSALATSFPYHAPKTNFAATNEVQPAGQMR
jgi:hypothetical protein